ncbi:hypothetical protein P280DRAFT_405152 [Massarina eburnea CBS 473.64]|uniref:Zn(2)-C6 fungal-type domain-containing protein n=1 Tax=Massarina eburnea CBS 473.64 TaxID=1395130 RepID=A0A6A6RS60_9PLEO|nr:hypothetical protein P280DRAFT_405152 [Massarina eburnea CBS 473.64]
MASQAHPISNIPISAAVDPAFWNQDLTDSSLLTAHLSPTASITAQGSLHTLTPPAQTPKSDGERGASNGQMAPNSQNDQNPAQARVSVPVACVPCRNRHLKCDGGVRCSRCRTDGVECTYIKSRRGWKGKRKKPGENGAPGYQNTLANRNASFSSGQSHSPQYAHSIALSTPNGVGVVPASAQLNLNGLERVELNQFGHVGPPTAIQAFFHYFYNAHPFCLPQLELAALFRARGAPLLEYAVQYIGSSFLKELPTEIYKEALNRTINSGGFVRDGFAVQALILFSIGLHANNEVPRAAQIFAIAHNLTLELGMNRIDFAIINGNNDPMLEESWRRTWWSMYTVNGMMTAVNPGIQFQLKDIATDVPLPCENEQYFSGQIPYPSTLQDYDDAPFALEQITFSSFAYLIDAIRILGKVFECARLDAQFAYHAVDVVDGYLVNWRLHLPASKLEIVKNDGVIDEVLFQAHMVNGGSTIMLHRPRSNLGFGRVENVNICVQPGQVLLPTQTREIHTAKCLTSAENINSLIKLPGPLTKHTPFFTCVVVMASVVHLSYWSFLVPDGQDDLIKQSIRLDVGTLQQYSNTWGIAHVVLGQVRGVAHTLFNSKKAMSIHLWNNIAQGDVIREVIAEGQMEPLQNYQQLIAP